MTPLELKNVIVNCLKSSNLFDAIYTFGSIAKGTSDEYSDIDLIVSVLDDKISLSEILHPYLTVSYYRSFSASSYPSGRYWFRGESPFQKLDISFHTTAEVNNIIAHGDSKTFKSPPFKCEWRFSSSMPARQSIMSNTNSCESYISEEEKMLSGHIYKLLCEIQSGFRMQSDEYSYQEILAQFLSDWIEHFRVTWDGGDLDELAKQSIFQLSQEKLHSYINVGEAKYSDRDNVRRHYSICKYGGNVSEESTTILGKLGKSIVGALRLSRENGILVLRAMQVLPILRGLGIGSKILQFTIPMLTNEKVFCLPYTHLVGFYSKVGFRSITETDLPEFLSLRLKEYHDKGLQVCAMELN